jgi:membrane protein required for beta-lactamase induction
LVTSSLALWLVIVLLALWAGAVRRRRRAALEAAWSEDTESDPPIN